MITMILLLSTVFAKDIKYQSNNEIDPNDYLFGSKSEKGDPVFNTKKIVDLNVDIGIGSDCGRISIKNTLNASLNNILNDVTDNFKGIGKSMVGKLPMLMTCYASPTWCAILKHSQINAHFLAELRMNQCNAINKFVDSRASEYYEERSSCAKESIHKNNGNMDAAMESCSNNNNLDMKDWSGGSAKTTTNKLIESTASWAKMDTSRGKNITNLAKAFVGDTVLENGKISVDYGPYNNHKQLSPRDYYLEVKSKTHKQLCDDLLPKVMNAGGPNTNLYKTVPQTNLPIDHQTIRALSHFPYQKRQMACKKLAESLAMGIYSEDMGQTLDFLSATLASNPHLPTQRKQEAEVKRKAFKDQVEMTMSLEKQNNQPLNQVLHQINSDGDEYVKKSTKRELDNNQDVAHSKMINEIFFDGADSN